MIPPMYAYIGLANSENVLNSKSLLLRNRVGACPGISLALTLTLPFSESAKFGRAPLSWAVVRISCSYLNTSSVNWFICQRRMFNLKKSMRMCPNLSQEVQVARVGRLSKCKEASSLPLRSKAHALTWVHDVNGVRSAWQCHVRFDGRRIHRVPLRASCILANCLHRSSTPARVVAISLLRCLDYVVLDRRPPTSDLRKYMYLCMFRLLFRKSETFD